MIARSWTGSPARRSSSNATTSSNAATSVVANPAPAVLCNGGVTPWRAERASTDDLAHCRLELEEPSWSDAIRQRLLGMRRKSEPACDVIAAGSGTVGGDGSCRLLVVGWRQGCGVFPQNEAKVLVRALLLSAVDDECVGEVARALPGPSGASRHAAVALDAISLSDAAVGGHGAGLQVVLGGQLRQRSRRGR